MLPARSDWMIVLVLVGISFWVVLMRLLRPLPARSGIDGWSAEVSCPTVSPTSVACLLVGHS